jgi:peptidoglycan/LPS O-acetylase OafA/YrhL
MLLGIGLHALLAYTGGYFWIVNDAQSYEPLGTLFSAIHGFRMPLFFLLSGFFTAMLWKKRGIRGLLNHRFKRIALPLLLSLSIITPLMWTTISWSQRRQAEITQAEPIAEPAPGERAPTPDIWTVASYGDMQGLAAYDADSDQLDAQDPMFGVTPLGWAAIKDQPAAAKYLLDMGADPSARYKDQNTPLHTACFFGRADVARHLLDAGADATLQSAAGERPSDSMSHDQQITEFFANMLQVPIDFEEVSAGRDQIREMIAELELAAATPAEEPAKSFADTIKALQGTTFFYHLWFLWFLCWLVAGFAVVVRILNFLPPLKLPSVLFSVPLCFVWLVPLTMLTQSHMSADIFGPDTSTGLIPLPHVLLYYATFFGFGSMMFASRGADKKLGSLWFVTLPLAFVVLPFGLIFSYDADKSAEMIGDETLRNLTRNLLQVLYVWLMTFGLLGLCEAVLTKERRWVRYLSDSSYWLYLAHLPLIVAGQGLLLSIEMPALVKFALLTSVTTVFLLVMYALFVRHTPIGVLLNGRRSRRPEGSTDLIG